MMVLLLLMPTRRRLTTVPIIEKGTEKGTEKGRVYSSLSLEMLICIIECTQFV